MAEYHANLGDTGRREGGVRCVMLLAASAPPAAQNL
jgi:hypothetical protein